MKLRITSVVLKIWLATILVVAFCLTVTSLIFLDVYKNYAYTKGMEEFDHTVTVINSLLEDNPREVLEHTDTFNLLDTRMVGLVQFDGVNYSLKNKTVPQVNDKTIRALTKLEGVREAIDAEGIDQVTDVYQYKHDSSKQIRNEEFIITVHHFDYEGKKGIAIYIFSMLSYQEALAELRELIILLVVIMVIISFIYMLFLHLYLGKPLNDMTNIAFEYAKNDFTHRAPVTSRDEMSQLALAMNKMGKSLETIGTMTRQEKELLTNILSTMVTGVIVFNNDGTVLLANPAGEHFLQKWIAVSHRLNGDSLPGEISIAIQQIVEYTERQRIELALDETYFQLVFDPLFNDDLKTVRGIVCSIRDMTDERRLDTMRVDFISNISHELRTPLMMIQGYSEAILDDIAQSKEEKHEMAKIIIEESNRMSRLVDQMLDLSRMEAGFIDLNYREVQIGDFLKKIVRHFQNMAQEKNVILDLEVETPDLVYVLDNDKIQQVLINLINNALRHTEEAQREDGLVTLIQYIEGDQLVLEVRDNGTGIEKSDIPYLFERFFKADRSRTSKESVGTGIGLSIVKNIVEAHNGRIEVQSDPMKYTRFIVYLPYE